jgi:hypothetical protein
MTDSDRARRSASQGNLSVGVILSGAKSKGSGQAPAGIQAFQPRQVASFLDSRFRDCHLFLREPLDTAPEEQGLLGANGCSALSSQIVELFTPSSRLPIVPSSGRSFRPRIEGLAAYRRAYLFRFRGNVHASPGALDHENGVGRTLVRGNDTPAWLLVYYAHPHPSVNQL